MRAFTSSRKRVTARWFCLYPTSPVTTRIVGRLDRLVADGCVRPMVLAAPSDRLAGEGTAYLPHPDADSRLG